MSTRPSMTELVCPGGMWWNVLGMRTLTICDNRDELIATVENVVEDLPGDDST